ncbi:DNA-binding domain-containing protein, KilA-N-like [Desulfonema magnum]|uniref:DNA-binding domain-containing protein, KilA-N-like n=1 Tax=Desulfonema magnum TaxID=45655 RepID=A0A975BXR8_9BACT|nr:DNA-binding domain-containing protein, KilA-N-like [Desulfonema magnum]
MAELHGQELKEINRIVNNNADWFDDEIDVVDLKKDIISDICSGVVSNHPSDFLIKSGYYTNTQAVGGARHIYLFSQQGYALLCKLLKSDLARQIYKQNRRYSQ